VRGAAVTLNKLFQLAAGRFCMPLCFQPASAVPAHAKVEFIISNTLDNFVPSPSPPGLFLIILPKKNFVLALGNI
jgi:hypothetical protein